MVYKVRLTGPAESDVYQAFGRIREVAPLSAERWLRKLFDTIATLMEMPDRCPTIPEADELGYPARHLLYGKRAGQYRIIFDIQEASDEGPRVRVLRIWHGSRETITMADIAPDP